MTGVEEELRELLRERAQPPALPAVRCNLVLARAGARRQRRRALAGTATGLVLFAAFVVTPLVAVARGVGSDRGAPQAGGEVAGGDVPPGAFEPQAGSRESPGSIKEHRPPDVAGTPVPAYLPAGYSVRPAPQATGLWLVGPHGRIALTPGEVVYVGHGGPPRQVVLARPVIGGRRGVLSRFPDLGVTLLYWRDATERQFSLSTTSTTLDRQELVKIARSLY